MNKVFIPVAIVISGLIIAGAIYLTNKQQAVNNMPAGENPQLEVKPVDSTDHIRGNPDADIVIVEYSDYECPFCKGFHGTMNRIMEEYGTTGKVAWVFRHFPLTQIHKSAQGAAEAAECAAKLGGNEKFWQYSDSLFAGSPESLTQDNLVAEATKIGLNETEFKACLASDYPKDKVAEYMKDGSQIAKADAQFGTPYNIVITKSGIQTVIRGNQPYSTVKGIIDSILFGNQPQ